MVARCKATTTSGAPCSAQPVRADGYCYWHSPATATARQENRRKGGAHRANSIRARRLYADTPLATEDVRALVAHVIRRTLAGDLDAPLANALAGLARTALAANEAATLADLTARLDALEARATGEPA
jgi:hypothetical protein